jgi:hypothetical protein
VLEIKDVKSCGCNGFFKGAEGVLQNVPWHCELEMVEFALQRAMQEDPFGLGRDRKVCKIFDESCSLLGLLLHEGLDILCRADGRTACNDSMHGMLRKKANRGPRHVGWRGKQHMLETQMG